MPKKPSTRGRKSKSERIPDLPAKARKVSNPERVKGGVSLSFGKVALEYKPQRGY